MVDNVSCHLSSSRYLRTSGSRGEPTIEIMACLTCYGQRTDCSIVGEVIVCRCTSSAICIPCYAIFALRLIELSGISSFTLYSNNRRRPCVVKCIVMRIGGCLRRGCTAIFRRFTISHLIGLQSRTVAVFPSDGIFTFGLVVNRRIGLCAFNGCKLCRIPSGERIIPLDILLISRISPCIRRGLTVFQLQIVEYRLTIIIHKRNLIFLGCLIELRNISLVSLDLGKAVAACALEFPACKLERVCTVVRLVRIFR